MQDLEQQPLQIGAMRHDRIGAMVLFRNVLRAVVVSCALLAAGCATTQRLQCSPSGEARPTRNFGRVLTAQGEPTPIYRGGQPLSCDQLRFLQSIGVKSILKLNDRGLPIDEDEKKEASALGLRVESLSFNAATIGNGSSCERVREALLFLQDPESWPVYVHCTAGKDRTGYIVGLYEKTILGTPAAAVLSELHRYGHTGIRSVVMSQIDRELAKDSPVCAKRLGVRRLAAAF
jgi:hypothetical protein